MEFIKPYKFKWSFEFVFNGPPVPYTRMTRGNMWTKAPQNYLGYRNKLADTIRAKFPELKLPPRPDKTDKKGEKLWLKEQKKITYGLQMDVWFSRDSGDYSNALKVLEDALQGAGVIWDDKMIKRFEGGDSKIDRENPRIEFKFWRLE